jgi:hypothetical protein
MHWGRALIFGVLLWLVPFAVAFLLFGIRQDNRALFESLITVIGVLSAVLAALAFFRHIQRVSWTIGLVLGAFWAGMSIVLDLPIFLVVFHMPLPEYLADIALTYLAFPIIVTGIAVAANRGAKGD